MAWLEASWSCHRPAVVSGFFAVSSPGIDPSTTKVWSRFGSRCRVSVPREIGSTGVNGQPVTS